MSQMNMKAKSESGGITHALKVSVPDSWQVVPLEEVLEDIVGGGTPSRDNPSYWNGRIPWLTVKDMRTRRPADSIDHISEEAVHDSATNVIPADTVIIATRIGLGKVIRVPYDAAINQDLKALITKPIVDKSYLEYWVYSIASYLESIGSGTTVKGIRLEHVRSLPFPLAPLGQQKRIVAEIEKQFSRLDKAVANLRRVKANLKRYKAAVLKAAVEGRLVETEAELARREGRTYETGEQLLQRILETRRSQWQGKGKYNEPAAPDTTYLPELPEGWVWATLDQIGQEGRPIIYGIIKPGPHVAKGVPYVRVTEMKDGFVDLENLRRAAPERAAKFARATLAPGDVLISKDGTIGRVAVVPPQLAGGNITQHVMRAPIHMLMCRDYVVWAIRSDFCQKWLTGETRGVALRGVNVEDFRRLPIPVPPVIEQERIVAEVDCRLSIAGETEAQADANLRRGGILRQTILEKAFSGQLIPDDPIAEPASVLLERIHAQEIQEQVKRAREATISKREQREVMMADLIEALEGAGDWISAQEAFRRCGVGVGADTDAIERLYAELRGYVRPGIIEVERRGEEDWLRVSTCKGV